MGRPSVITPELAGLLESVRAPGLSVELVHKRLIDAGGVASLSTVRRYLAKPPAAAVPGHMAPPKAYTRPAVTKLAEAALQGDDLAELHAAKAAVSAALKGWEGSLGFDPRGVRAYSALVGLLKSVTAAIVELTPRTAEDRYAPVEGAALADAIARARAAASSEVDLRAQIARQRQVIDQLVDAGPE